jgi:hypothetical protein
MAATLKSHTRVIDVKLKAKVRVLDDVTELPFLEDAEPDDPDRRTLYIEGDADALENSDEDTRKCLILDGALEQSVAKALHELGVDDEWEPCEYECHDLDGPRVLYACTSEELARGAIVLTTTRDLAERRYLVLELSVQRKAADDDHLDPSPKRPNVLT